MDYISRYGLDFNPFIKNANKVIVETTEYKEIIYRLNYLLLHTNHDEKYGRKIEIQMHLVKAHLVIDQLEKAKEICLRALKECPDFPDALFHLSGIQMKEAVELYKQADGNLLQCKKVLKEYRGIVSPDPQLAKWSADVLRGDIARLVGKLATAKQIYETFIPICTDQDVSNQFHGYWDMIEQQRKKLNQLTQTSEK